MVSETGRPRLNKRQSAALQKVMEVRRGGYFFPEGHYMQALAEFISEMTRCQYNGARNAVREMREAGIIQL